MLCSYFSCRVKTYLWQSCYCILFIPTLWWPVWQDVDPTALDGDDEHEDEHEEEEEDDDVEVEGAVMGGSSSRTAVATRAAAMRKELDGEIMEMLLKQVVPRAVHLYLDGPIQVRHHYQTCCVGSMPVVQVVPNLW